MLRSSLEATGAKPGRKYHSRVAAYLERTTLLDFRVRGTNGAIDIARSSRRDEPLRQEFLVGADGPHCGIGLRALEAALNDRRVLPVDDALMTLAAAL